MEGTLSGWTLDESHHRRRWKLTATGNGASFSGEVEVCDGKPFSEFSEEWPHPELLGKRRGRGSVGDEKVHIERMLEALTAEPDAKAAFLAEVARKIWPIVWNHWHRMKAYPQVPAFEKQWADARTFLEALGFTPAEINALATTGELPKEESDATG